MLDGADVRSTPLLDAMKETFKMTDVSESIPRYIKKAMGMLRRDANKIRIEKEMNECLHSKSLFLITPAWLIHL